MDSFSTATANALGRESKSRSAPKPIYARTLNRNRISPSTYQSMWQIFQAHYDGVSWDQFMKDIQEKSHVILIFDHQSHKLCGFSTISAKTHTVDKKKQRVVFSGDTILASSYRGTTVLAWAFFRFLFGQWLRRPHLPPRWLLISKGYKTYLLLARNFLDYYPSYKAPTPSHVQALLDQACQDRFQDAYRPHLGIVRFETQQCKLKPSVAPIGPRELADPDIAFFVQANPGHQHGDELACLGYFTPWMILHFLKRTLRAKRP